MTGRLRTVPLLIYHRLVGVMKPWLRPLLPVSGIGLILRKDLEVPLVPYHARVPVEIVVASEHEVEAAARLRDPDGRLTAIYRSRWRRGHKCFVAKNGSAVIASNWLIFRAEIDSVDFTVVGDGEVICADAFTAPAWRGKAIHTAVLCRMLEWARGAGYRVAYTSVGAGNRRSWISHSRLGWEIALVIIRIRVRWMKKEWVWLSNASSHPMRGSFARYLRGGMAADDATRTNHRGKRGNHDIRQLHCAVRCRIPSLNGELPVIIGQNGAGKDHVHRRHLRYPVVSGFDRDEIPGVDAVNGSGSPPSH